MPRKKKSDKSVRDETPLADEERTEEAHAEESTDLAVPAETVLEGQLTDTNIVAEQGVERETDTDAVVPAEDAAVHTDTTVAKEASGEGKKSKAPSSKPKSSGRTAKTAKRRSVKYQAAAGAVDQDRRYSLQDAIELAKQTSYTKFDGSLELHVRLMPRKGKGESDSIRGLLQLPHGTGKAVNAIILTEAIIDQIAKDKTTKYDILIAPRALMPKVAKVAKVLGPQGKMPSPKAGTVTDTPDEVLASIQSGRVEYRADAAGIIHQAIGKVSWDDTKLRENAQAVLGALGSLQLRSVTLAATMGPGIPVDLSTLTR
ncbi:50S ribosomal protein L1 [Candidatus Berkelbacteria bacterium]|nr:50S ribosomal protein L1 [Candidatus Berkelbacteria bacterium]